MADWSVGFEREERVEIPEGDYRVAITAVEEKKSQAGNDMLVITLKLCGANITVKDYIVKNKWFNRNMTEFFDSFNIDEGDFNILTWIGASGAAKFKRDEKGYLKKAWYIPASKIEELNLPEWDKQPERQTVTEMEDLSEDDDLPF